ncbi:amino acid adenylation domain-containing protein [Amycolatopsis arida]|uniref:Amino acid adenylation domain-containing protein n=1 Tax=Amycolatopsis arida TaxID=587909 RepID=A0A1I5P2X2_9PSEU|nr:amino acid adenylation domain-containing protein [Amycolatopsis arida]TDX98319.1 amino acid adenylation domain-containing protein [Amycolatopsis arida]SFP27846.1 amino acid adenylation domain-containing protein [Amycolatopsis arida]
MQGAATFHDYLLAHSAMAPTDPAIVSPRASWTHGQLRERVLRYAADLHRHGLRAGDLVVLEFAPTPEAVALMIATARLGVVFVPVGPELPPARKHRLRARVEPRAWITAERLVSGGLDLGDPVVPRGPARAPTPDDVAYVVFTSGSTGEPKGITMTHRAVVTCWRGFAGIGVEPGVRLGSPAPLQFDFALFDLGMALGAGGCLVQVPSLLTHQPRGFVRYLARHGVTQVNGVPSVWRAILAAEAAHLLRSTPLRTVVCGGEDFPASGFRALRAGRPGLRLVHVFGQSESIACTYKVLPDPVPEWRGRAPCGGTAIPGLRMAIVDESGRAVTEPHAIGECYLAGPGLFRGYWRDPAATADALVPGPPGGPADTAFRSGDLVVRDERGDLYFAGRRDRRVKVLGNRVEPGEVELHLARHPGVVQAACVLTADGAGLVAHVQAAGEVTEEALRRHCVTHLPRYMVPHRFVRHDRLPVTTNGKIDHRALAVT